MSQSRPRPQQSTELPGARPEPTVSRRAMLRDLGAGAAALATAPALLTGTRAAATTAAAAAAGRPRAADSLAGLHGATLRLAAFPSGTTWAQAITAWEGYTSTTIKAAKMYFGPGEFPTSIGSEIQTYISAGIKVLISFKPAYDPPTRADLTALENALRMYQAAGMAGTITLWQEPQHVMTASQFHRVFQYYGPTIRKYYNLAYDVTGGAGPTKWTNYYPGCSLTDVVAIDYYAPTYLKGITLDAIAALADHGNLPKPFGIWEMGNTAGGGKPTQAQMDSFFSYVQSFMAARLQAGKANAEILWYNGDGTNTISSSTDYRVPLWDSLVNATS